MSNVVQTQADMLELFQNKMQWKCSKIQFKSVNVGLKNETKMGLDM